MNACGSGTYNGIGVLLRKERPELSLPDMWGHREKVAICQEEEPNLRDLNLGLPRLQPCESKCQLFQHLAYGIL